LTENKAKLCKNMLITLVYEKNAIFFRRKLLSQHRPLAAHLHRLVCFQFSATFSASWTCISHGLLTGYTAQALPSLMKEDSGMEMTKMHMTWISKTFFMIYKNIFLKLPPYAYPHDP
jgi:hypothetical protein